MIIGENNFIYKLTKTKLSCGKNLIELTEYNDTALWWFVDFGFHSFIYKLLNEEPFIKPAGAEYGKIKIYLSAAKALLKKIFINIIIMAYRRKQCARISNNKSTKILFVAQDLQWTNVVDYKKNRVKKSDGFFDSITERLKGDNRFDMLSTYPLGNSKLSLNVFINKLKYWSILHKPFDVYWSLKAWRMERRARRHFENIWKVLAEDKMLEQLCDYNGKCLYDQVKAKLNLYFKSVFPNAVKNIEMAKQMIGKDRPDLILLLYEYSGFGRALVVAGKLCGVPTLAIQHGSIGPFHKGYMYTRDEVSTVKSAKSPFCPIPDKIALYGPYYKDLLTKVSSYPEDSVVVTGQPRYDILAEADKVFNRKDVFKKIQLDENKKLIVWTTQTHGKEISAEEKRRSFYAVYGAMKNFLDKCQLVIKLHPAEFDISMHKETAKDLGVDPIIIKDIDTFELLYACDLLITIHSTTAIEAIMLNKPVITINFSGQSDRKSYAESGAALGVYNEKDLIAAIKGALYNAEIREKLKKEREKFVYEHTYKMDGMATERIGRLIGEMIESAKKK